MAAESPYRVAEWLPSDQAVLENWLSKLIEKVDGGQTPKDDEKEDDLLPAIQEFKDTVENDAELMMFFNLMFEEVPFSQDPTGQPQVKDYKQMFRLLNAIMEQAPEYN